MDDFDYETQAQEFRAASELLGRFATPEGARELVDVLTSENHDRFHELVAGVSWPESDPRLICHKSCTLIGGSLGRLTTVTTCRLRTDLSRGERVQYLLIWLRHFSLLAHVEPAPEREPRVVAGGDDVIPEGPFLDELKAAGLVVCETTFVRNRFRCEIVCD